MEGFIQMSKYAGMREDLVQASGGNSACKLSSDRMAVKASGYQLAELTETSGYALVNYQMIRDAFLQYKDLKNMSEEDSKRILQDAFLEGDRPSIETFLHAVSGKYSLHTHPIVVNILTSRAGGMEQIQEMFPDAWIIPYATPGVELAKACFERYKELGRDASVVFLQNHGLLVSADTAEKTIAITEETVQRLEEYLELDMSGYHAVTQLYDAVGEGIFWRVTDQHVLNAGKKLGRKWEYAFCPDCVVFLGKRMYDAGSGMDIAKLKKFCADCGEPVVVVYQDRLYIHAESVRKALEIQSVLSFAAQVMQENYGHKCSFLTEREQDFLLDWDAEKYRKQKH